MAGWWTLVQDLAAVHPGFWLLRLLSTSLLAALWAAVALLAVVWIGLLSSLHLGSLEPLWFAGT